MRYVLAALLAIFSTGATGEQVAVATSNGDSIELHDYLHGKCPKQAGVGEARYVWGSGKTIDGCWKIVVERDAVFVVFEDGDSFLIPISAWSWRAGRKPATL